LNAKVISQNKLETIETDRLLLRRPRPAYAVGIFSRFASDPGVTRFMSWPCHRTLADTEAFLSWSDADWDRWPAGSYLIFAKDRPGLLLGSTGLSFQDPHRAITGYILARDAWGQGYATEALLAMVELAQRLGVRRLEAACHIDHTASAHVLEKGGFHCGGILREHGRFPNLDPGKLFDVREYVREFKP